MWDTLLQNPPYLYSAIFIFSLIVGSFLNVVIYRLPLMMFSDYEKQCCEFLTEQGVKVNSTKAAFSQNLVFPASSCPKCNHALAWYDNIPLLSFLLILGKCRYCQKPISIRYPIIELSAALMGTLAYYQFGFTPYMVLIALLSWVLLVITAIDLDYQIIPDDLVIPSTWGILLFQSFHLGTLSLNEALYGAVFGYLSLWSVYIVFKLLTHKEGMGHGDFKLLALIGALLGIKLTCLVILLASIAGTFVGIVSIVLGRLEAGKAIPFGPYLAFGALVAVYIGEPILTLYFKVVSG